MDALTVLDLTGSSVAENLALDEALLIEADAGGGRPTLRFWEPAGFAVVMGASCRLQAEVNVDACRADGVPILRRTSGGGTVVVGPGALSVTVILPESAAPGLTTVPGAQLYVLDWIARSIRTAGPAVALDGLGDLVIDGRKCGGSAQRRLKHWLMVHCSILYEFPLERIARYLPIPPRQPQYRRGRDHCDFLRNLGLARNILVDAIRRDCVTRSTSPAGQSLPKGMVQTLLSEKFTNPGWIERF